MSDMSDNIVVVNTKPRMVVLSTDPLVKLAPGENDVPKDFLDRLIKSSDTVKSWFYGPKGVKFLGIKKGAKKADPIIERLDSMNAAKAIELIKGTTSADLLGKWARKESRARVNAAIKRRQQELDKAEESQD